MSPPRTEPARGRAAAIKARARRVVARTLVGRARRVVDRAVVVGAPDRPVFVGACPRSGTTMLRSMLQAHPDLALPRETRFLLEAYRERHNFGDLRIPANREALARWVVERPRWTQFRRLGLEPDEAIRRMTEAGPTIGSILGTPLQLYAEAQGRPRWGDKRPKYVQHLPAIFGMFPDAQFVAMVRDPRGAVASMKKLGWFDGDVVVALDLWLLSFAAIRRATAVYRDDQLQVVRYEDLVSAPEEQLRSLCRFLGLSAEHLPQMVAFHEDANIPQNRYHWRVSRPVDPAAVSGWASVLTPEEVAFVERVAAWQMARYGYEPSSPDVDVPRALLGKAEQRRRQRPRRPPVTPTGERGIAARLTSAQRRRAALPGLLGAGVLRVSR